MSKINEIKVKESTFDIEDKAAQEELLNCVRRKELEEKNYASKEYVNNEIANFDFIKVVDVLPETGLPNRIYFIPKQDTQTQDLFDEYVWVNNTWEWITTKQIEVDFSDYYNKDETTELLNNKANNDTVNNLTSRVSNIENQLDGLEEALRGV